MIRYHEPLKAALNTLMRLKEFNNPGKNFAEMFRKFLPVAMETIELTSLPEFNFVSHVESPGQPSFGQYIAQENVMYVALANRHPVDILRTIAHELVHYKQDTEHQLNIHSGDTGSLEENQAHQLAGIVMRHFNKMYPEYLEAKPIMMETWSTKYKRSIDCDNPKGFSQRAHCQGRKKNESSGDRGDIPTGPGEQLIPFPAGTTMIDVSDAYDWYKLGMVISDLDDADPKIFGQGAPHTAIVFGSEEEEHKLLPLLKRLGLSVHDIDKPQDVKKAIPAKALIQRMEENFAEDSEECPPATQDIKLNLENRQKAINEYGYGPLNPDLPNTKFWLKKVDEWNLDSADEAKQSLCGNCAAFDVRQKTLDCIAKGIDSENSQDAEAVIDAGDLGYCKFLKFKCASRRTCDAWVTGGPLTDSGKSDQQGVAEGVAGPLPPVLYHGGPKPITKFNIPPYGVYFSPHIDWAKGYGDVITTAKVNAQKVYLIDYKNDIDEEIMEALFDMDYKEVAEFIKLLQAEGYQAMQSVSDSEMVVVFPGTSIEILDNKQSVEENFADGRNPQDKGDSARHGIRKGMTIAQLKKIRSSKTASARKKQLAHWQINMRQGKKKP